MGDLDGDGRDDVCARDEEGVRCHLAEDEGFGDGFDGPNLSDDGGWDDPSNYMTMRLADVTGDGKMDLCARANAGMRCYPYEDESFGDYFGGPLHDDSGWYRERFYRTIHFADINADGKADLCARSSQALVCWHSTGEDFEETIVEGPAWSDDEDFDQPEYYSTMRMLGPVGPVPEEPEDPTEDAGVADAGAEEGDAAAGVDDSGTGDRDASAPSSDASGASGSDSAAVRADGSVSQQAGATGTGTCACRTGGAAPAPRVAMFLALLGLVIWRRTSLIEQRAADQAD